MDPALMDAFMAMQAGGKPDMGALAVDDSPLMPQPDLPPVDGMVEVAGHKFTPDVADHVEQIMSAVDGLKVVSGGRDAHTNRIHRGVAGSLHLDGRAVDFSGSAGAIQKAAGAGRQLGATEVSIHNPGGGQIVHIGW